MIEPLEAQEKGGWGKKISAAATSRNAIFKEAKLRSIESNRNMEIIDNSRDATYCCAS
jgi:hypothetical protein